MDATCITLWLKTIKRLTLIKLILEESNKITLGPNQNQLNTTLFYSSTITNFYGCSLRYFMAKNKSKDEL
jgi:hypothetical protein